MSSFKYVCKCESKPPIALKGSLDSPEATQLDKALDQLVDSAWGDEDEEADDLLACFIANLKKANYTISESGFEDIFNVDKTIGPNAILTYLSQDEGACHCRQVSQRISIALNWGLAELHCKSEPNELRLLEVLELVEPFADILISDRGSQTFLQQLWKFSVESGKIKLTVKLISIYPNELNRLLDRLLNFDSTRGESFLDSLDFNDLIPMISLPEVFQHVSLYLAERDPLCSVQAEILLKELLRTVKTNLPKNKFLDLYPDRLSPVALVLNETFNPDDPLVLNMLDEVKKECFLDFVILVTHFPLFLHLK